MTETLSSFVHASQQVKVDFIPMEETYAVVYSLAKPACITKTNFDFTYKLLTAIYKYQFDAGKAAAKFPPSEVYCAKLRFFYFVLSDISYVGLRFRWNPW